VCYVCGGRRVGSVLEQFLFDGVFEVLFGDIYHGWCFCMVGVMILGLVVR